MMLMVITGNYGQSPRRSTRDLGAATRLRMNRLVQKVPRGTITPPSGIVLLSSPSPCLTQALDSIAGRTIEVTITSGTEPWFASSGVYDFLTSIDTDLYVVVPVTGDVSPSYGTYTYAKTASNKGRVDFTDIVEEIEARGAITFISASSGSLVITIPDEPGVQQSGNFVVFAGPAPDSIASTVFAVNVTSGESPFASFGSFNMALNVTGTAYTIDGEFPVLDSTGTCAYQKTGTSVGVVDLVDSRVGVATTHLSFKTATSGTYYAVSGDLSGYQTGVFSMVAPTAPLITQHPRSQTQIVGETAEFSVVANGTEPLSFQWQKGGTTLANGGQISGAQSSTLTISDLAEGDAGEYRVMVSNSAGQMTSQWAVLTVVGRPRLEIGQGNTPAGFELMLTSQGGFDYRIEASADLQEWTTVAPSRRWMARGRSLTRTLLKWTTASTGRSGNRRAAM